MFPKIGHGVGPGGMFCDATEDLNFLEMKYNKGKKKMMKKMKKNMADKISRIS